MLFTAKIPLALPEMGYERQPSPTRSNHSPPRDRPPTRQGYRIFIGGLPFSVGDEDLKKKAEAYGKVGAYFFISVCPWPRAQPAAP